jgi:RNA polymerase sporulation-specific sigma factor
VIDVSQHLHLVHHVIRKYKLKPLGYLDHDDLFQIGCLGLLIAAKKFDESLGYKFSSYAIPSIRYHILREVYGKNKRKKRYGVAYSLDRTLVEDGASLGEMIPSPENIESDFEKREEVKRLMKFDPLLISMYYMGYTQTEIANQIGVSVQRVNQRLKQIKRKVRANA